MSKLIFMFRFTHQLFCQIVFFEFVSAHQHVKLHTMRSIHIHTAQNTPRQMDGKKKRSQTIRMIDTRIRWAFFYCICVHITFARTKIYLCTLALLLPLLLLLIVFKCCTQFTLLRIKNHLVN